MGALSVFIKATVIYIGLLVAMKLLGKRQAGEMQISELITTFLVSEIATLPITDPDMPFYVPIIALGAIIGLEFVISMLALKIPLVREFLEGKPSALIKNGKPDKKELKRARMSMDELLSELRLQGIAEPDEVLHATLESNGKMSVIQKSEHRPLSFNSLGIKIKEEGVAHAVITAGRIDKNELYAAHKNEKWLEDFLKRKKATPKNVLLLTVTDGGKIFYCEENK